MFGPASTPDGCTYRPVPFWEARPLITPRSIFAHTMSARGRSTVQSAFNHATANPHTNTLPHYALGLDEQDGCAKFLPTNRRGIGNATVTSGHAKWPTLTAAQRADILAHGNRSISWWSLLIETADTGTNTDPAISAFTDYQLEMLTRIYVHEAAGWDIPAVPLPDWHGAGMATHTEPWNYPFTTLYIKTCPGGKKKAQFWSEVLPEVRRRLAPPPPTPEPVPPTPPILDLGDLIMTADGKFIAAILDRDIPGVAGKGSFWRGDGTTRIHTGGKRARLVAAGGLVDCGTDRRVTSWSQVTTVDPTTLDKHVGIWDGSTSEAE